MKILCHGSGWLKCHIIEAITICLDLWTSYCRIFRFPYLDLSDLVLMFPRELQRKIAEMRCEAQRREECGLERELLCGLRDFLWFASGWYGDWLLRVCIFHVRETLFPVYGRGAGLEGLWWLNGLLKVWRVMRFASFLLAFLGFSSRERENWVGGFGGMKSMWCVVWDVMCGLAFHVEGLPKSKLLGRIEYTTTPYVIKYM